MYLKIMQNYLRSNEKKTNMKPFWFEQNKMFFWGFSIHFFRANSELFSVSKNCYFVVSTDGEWCHIEIKVRIQL